VDGRCSAANAVLTIVRVVRDISQDSVDVAQTNSLELYTELQTVDAILLLYRLQHAAV